jgi:hypothetical protein
MRVDDLLNDQRLLSQLARFSLRQSGNDLPAQAKE